jgi:hypothetical protein
MNYVKLAIYAAIVAFVVWLGHFIYDAGANSVQTKWNAANTALANAATKDANTALQAQIAQGNNFVTIDSTYQKGVANAQTIGASFSASVHAGTVGLRPEWGCQASAGAVRAASTGSGGPDLAAAAAATQRLADATTIVRLAYAADRREATLDARIVAQSALLQADRKQGAKP